MTLRYCIPRVQGRGAGLGNKLVPWARSFLAGKFRGANRLPPSSGLDTRRYWRHFGTLRLDWLGPRVLAKILPTVEFTEADYLRHGAGDFVSTFKPFADVNRLQQRGNFVLLTEGMWGGYRHIAQARDFIYTTLYQSKYAARNLLTIQSRLDPNKIAVGMHLRMGDFAFTPIDLLDYQGKFNLTLPLAWYRNIALSIQGQLGDAVQFLVVTDGNVAQLAPLLSGLTTVTTTDIPDSDCSDLLALANADLLVCPVSFSSSTAAFLSKKPYLWFEPNLQRHPQGFSSIWDHELSQTLPGSPTRSAIEAASNTAPDLARGVPVGIGGNVSPTLLQKLTAYKQVQGHMADLIRYGVVRAAHRSVNH